MLSGEPPECGIDRRFLNAIDRSLNVRAIDCSLDGRGCIFLASGVKRRAAKAWNRTVIFERDKLYAERAWLDIPSERKGIRERASSSERSHCFSLLMQLRMLEVRVGKGRQLIIQLCSRVLQSAGYVLYRALVFERDRRDRSPGMGKKSAWLRIPSESSRIASFLS